MGKTYTRWEIKLINEYIQENYPNCLQWRRVRLGPLPGTPPSKLYQGLRRWADRIIFTGKEVIILEGKMSPRAEGVTELEIYRKLFPETPEFSSLAKYPVRCVFLTTKHDETIETICKEHGIEYVVFAPEWTKKYWELKARGAPVTPEILMPKPPE